MRLLLFAMLLLAACSSRGTDKKQTEAKSNQKFKMVEIPVTLNSPQARLDYLAERYWDNFDFSDTTLISNTDISEQGFVDYISIIGQVDSANVRSSVWSMLAKAEVDSAMFTHFCELSERYLYDPNSPMRNEDLYIPVLEYIIASPKVEQIMKVRPMALLEMALKNRPGARTADFGYVTIAGKRGRLYALKSKYTLLFFNNPGCHACGEITAQIGGSGVFNDLLDSRKMTILALYSDKDQAEWRKHAHTIPARWINSCDVSQTINDKELYDLKAIPTLYLLDSDKRVLLKDATFGAVEQYLVTYDSSDTTSTTPE